MARWLRDLEGAQGSWAPLHAFGEKSLVKEFTYSIGAGEHWGLQCHLEKRDLVTSSSCDDKKEIDRMKGVHLRSFFTGIPPATSRRPFF